MTAYSHQFDLFGESRQEPRLPGSFEPVRPEYLNISRIYLSKGSISNTERRRFVDKICQIYPEVAIIERLDISHNRLQQNTKETLERHREGKRTLVFGELKTAVRFSKEEGNTCPNYWHFSPYGFCPFGCRYCYLAGTPGVKFSPTIKIYVNLPEMLSEIDRTAMKIKKETPFYAGKLQDPLALDSLTAYSTIMIPFFADHPYARLTLLTKSDNVTRLIDLDHRGHTILSWSVNPPEICNLFEENTPHIENRLEAMHKSAAAGYPVRAAMMPLIPVDGWRDIYTVFTERLIREIPLQRLTLGGICFYKGARYLMERKIGNTNAISSHIPERNAKGNDGRSRYPRELRKELYSHIIKTVKKANPSLEVALCLEELDLWQQTGIEKNLGRCNCVI